MERLVQQWDAFDASEKNGKLRVTISSDSDVAATFESAQAEALKLDVVLLGTNLESDVKRGENSGRKLRHDFVVLDLIQTDMTKESSYWTGSIALPKQSGDEKPARLRHGSRKKGCRSKQPAAGLLAVSSEKVIESSRCARHYQQTAPANRHLGIDGIPPSRLVRS